MKKNVPKKERSRKMSELQIGIIGFGKIAQTRHIPEFAANSGCRLRGFYNPTVTRAEEVSARYGGIVYSSAEELIADPGLDAVVVCTPNETHCTYSVAALRAGKHVLCEKPMALTLSDCECMVSAAEEAGRILMIGQNQRLKPEYAAARELLQSGAVGKVLTFRSCFCHAGPEHWAIVPGNGTWFFSAERSGLGVMGDLGVHMIDVIRFLLDDEVKSIRSIMKTLDKTDLSGNRIRVPDNALCLVEMQNGPIGTVSSSWTYYGNTDNSTVISGTEGVLRINDGKSSSLCFYPSVGEPQRFDYSGRPRNSGVADAFIRSILTGTAPPSSGRDVLGSMRAVFDAMRFSE